MGMGPQNRSEEWRWQEAKVDRAADHLRLYFQEDDEPSALVGAPRDNCFPVEFSLGYTSGAGARLLHAASIERQPNRCILRAELVGL
jgi:hypothetical protein